MYGNVREICGWETYENLGSTTILFLPVQVSCKAYFFGIFCLIITVPEYHGVSESGLLKDLRLKSAELLIITRQYIYIQIKKMF